MVDTGLEAWNMVGYYFLSVDGSYCCPRELFLFLFLRGLFL